MESAEARMEDYEDDSQNSFEKVYGWFVVVNRVTENDITKHDIVYKKKLIEVLNQLSYLLDFDKEMEKKTKKMMKQG